jgi:hypothetical protein
MIKVNMFGNGVRVWVCDIDESLSMHLESARGKQSWEAVLMDYSYLKHFGFDHWSQLSNLPAIIGLKLELKSSIEIKLKTKKLGRFCGLELINQASLFPLYNTIKQGLLPKKESQRRILIVEEETGQTHSFGIEQNNIIMNDLEFILQEFGSETFCVGLCFNHQQLTSQHSDTVTRGVRIFI